MLVSICRDDDALGTEYKTIASAQESEHHIRLSMGYLLYQRPVTGSEKLSYSTCDCEGLRPREYHKEAESRRNLDWLGAHAE